MADNDSPFARSDATLLRPRPGGGKRGSGDTSLTPRAAPEVGDVEPIAPAARALLGVGLNPLVQAASPLLMLIGPAAGRRFRRWMSPVFVDTRSTRFAGSKSTHAAAGVQNDIVLIAALRAVRGCGRSRVIDAVGRPERVGAASSVGDAAPRSVGRREVLRDARSDLG